MKKTFTNVMVVALALMFISFFLTWIASATILTIDVIVDALFDEVTFRQIVTCIVVDIGAFIGIAWLIVEADKEKEELEKQRQELWNNLLHYNRRNKK